jgi:hypothetical protein
MRVFWAAVAVCACFAIAQAASAQALQMALSEQNSKYLERPSSRSDRPGKMQENQYEANLTLE